MPRIANRLTQFGTTIFTEINTLARQHEAVNLGQGAPDFDSPPLMLEAAVTALHSGSNQYPPGQGIPAVREAVAGYYQRFYGMSLDPTTEVMLTAGATEGLFAALMGLTEPGDEVILFEPYYDAYLPGLAMAGATPSFVTLHAPHWTFDLAELRAAFTPRTRALILNTPHNPLGKVFSREELMQIAALCIEHDVLVITDEVYEQLIFDGQAHIPIATLPGMAERTLTLSSLGKTFSATGWKVGWAVGDRNLIAALLRAHQFIIFAVASPLQQAAIAALNFPDRYFSSLRQTFQARRDALCFTLQQVGFVCEPPQGGYFVVADWRPVAPESLRDQDDMAFARWLIQTAGVACIPVGAFYRPTHRHLEPPGARFAFCKRDETLAAAVERLKRIRVQS